MLTLGCGYSLRTAKERGLLLEREHVRRVFVAPPVNQSLKAGLETLIYSELIRVIKEHDQVVWVHDRASADAVIESVISWADASVSSQDKAENMVGGATIDPKFRTVLVPREYMANLGCTFFLTRENPPEHSGERIWTTSLQRGTPYPSASQAGPAGATAPLINASEFDRATAENARKMMADLREVLFSTF
jgi:hypothetical protein